MQELTPQIKEEIIDKAQAVWDQIGRDCLFNSRDYGPTRRAEATQAEVIDMVLDHLYLEKMSAQARQWYHDWAGTPEKRALMREAFPDATYGL